MKKRILQILDGMKAGTFERDEALSLSLLSALSGENTFLLGLPGVGKSMIARRLKLAFRNARVFEYLMSRFSTPDEIFGPVSISKLKDEDTYERIVEGYLPDAEIVFLDEIWKAGPAIQNSLLTVLNEKIYLNGKHELQLPLKGVIAASNELPAKGEGLEALWDRFLIRYIVEPIETKSNFFQLLCPEELSTSVAELEPLGEDEYRRIITESRKVKVPPKILDIIYAIRQKLNDKAEGKDDKEDDREARDNEDNIAKYYVSDRRWKKAVGILRTSAYLNDRKEVDTSDVLLLCHILWNEDSTIDEVQRIVAEELIAGLFAELLEKYKNIKRNAGKPSANDNRIYSPDGMHYIVKCDDAPLKIKVSDYDMMRRNPDEVYFGSETSAGVIRIQSRGQFVIRYVREGFLSVNNYNYPLKTVADKRLGQEFVEEAKDSVDTINTFLFRNMKENIFINSPKIVGRIREIGRLYTEKLNKI